MKLLPKGFSSSLKDVTSQFLQGIWYGMGPNPKKITKKTKEVKSNKLRRVK